MDKQRVSISRQLQSSMGGHAAALIGAAMIMGAQANAAATAPEAGQADATSTSLRVQVDAQRGRVWVLREDAVYLYDLPARHLVKRIELPGWLLIDAGFACAPGLAIAPSGAAFVTSNAVAVLWEIAPLTLKVRRHRLALDAQPSRDISFTGLAFGRGGRELIAVSSPPGSAWRIDLQAGTAHQLAQPAPPCRAAGPW